MIYALSEKATSRTWNVRTTPRWMDATPGDCPYDLLTKLGGAVIKTDHIDCSPS